MFILSKIATYLILPPGIILVLLVVAYFLRLGKLGRPANTLFLTCIGLLYLLSVEPVSDLLITPLEIKYSPVAVKRLENVDHIVVLGGGSVCVSPEYGGSGSLEPDALKRVVYAANLYGRLRVPIIASGGVVLNKRECEPEGEIAVRTLEELGIPPHHLFAESQSRNTYENARYVVSKYSPGRILLVTSAYHMPRSMLSFSKLDIECIPAPTDYKRRQSGYNFRSFMPGIGELETSYRALHEYVGILYYRMRY